MRLTQDQEPYSVDEDETDSGSSSVGDEEVSWSCTSEEEVEATKPTEYEATKPTEDEAHETCSLLQLVKKSASGTQRDAPFSAVFGHSAPQPHRVLSLNTALELPQETPARTQLSSGALAFNPSGDAMRTAQQTPVKTKLRSNALVFVPGASKTSVSNTKSSEPAGRDLLALLKGDSTNAPSEPPSESLQKPGRSKLSTSAQVFVPKVRFVPQPPVVQPSDFGPVQPLAGSDGFPNSAQPMVQMLPALMIPMCVTNFADTCATNPNDGFDDSPRAIYPDSPIVAVHGTGLVTQQTWGSDEQPIDDDNDNEEAAPQPQPKACWADLYEDEDDSLDIWLDETEGFSFQKTERNELLSLS